MTGVDSPPERIRGYYDALDSHAYDRLRDLLAPDFVHERPDRTLKGRERFVTFMREERPQTATSHPIETITTTPESSRTCGASGSKSWPMWRTISPVLRASLQRTENAVGVSLDANLEPRTAEFLRKEGYRAEYSDYVLDEDADDTDDILPDVQQEELMIVTADIKNFAPLADSQHEGLLSVNNQRVSL